MKLESGVFSLPTGKADLIGDIWKLYQVSG